MQRSSLQSSVNALRLRINLPLGAVAVAVVWKLLPLKKVDGNVKEKLKRVDYLGSVLICLASVLMLVSQLHFSLSRSLVILVIHQLGLEW